MEYPCDELLNHYFKMAFLKMLLMIRINACNYIKGKTPHRTEQNKKTDENYFEYDFY